jgi:hypothetical protein
MIKPIETTNINLKLSIAITQFFGDVVDATVTKWMASNYSSCYQVATVDYSESLQGDQSVFGTGGVETTMLAYPRAQ